jgi:hypothetical protein
MLLDYHKWYKSACVNGTKAPMEQMVLDHLCHHNWYKTASEDDRM